MGEVLQLSTNTRVLDIASGRGSSAVFLAERFGCDVTGIDYGSENVERADANAAARGLQKRVRFQVADAERLPFADASFDAVICECALCLFPDKTAATREIGRVIRAGGRLGISDLTRSSMRPIELSGLLAWALCIADAQPLETYLGILYQAGLAVELVEQHDEVLLEMVDRIRGRLLGAEILIGLNKLNLPGLDVKLAKQLVRCAIAAVKEHRLGYDIIAAVNGKKSVSNVTIDRKSDDWTQANRGA